ncbi:MAG: class I SAM-dependent methyltransferase [Candidatus Omnitrophica bacterium]|nr:class I SAM-dependent methyltransferase [Candidatus Omnitrophota bacterium]
MANFFKIRNNHELLECDSPQSMKLHRDIIGRKPFLQKIYSDFYILFKNKIGEKSFEKVIIEIGSGGGSIKKIIPEAITSDATGVAWLDIVFSAQDIPFKDRSVDCFLLLNVLHHLSDPLKAIAEMQRCLKMNGKIIMVEPANTPWRRFVDKRFHHEKFDTNGDYKGVNGALPWIIFIRDLEMFKSSFSRLRIKEISFHTPFKYLLSGGFAFKQLIPGFLYGVIGFFEFCLSPLNKYIGYFQTIELEKIEL